LSSPSYQQALGRKIAAERRRRGLSQPELARLLGRSVAWVSQVERGVRKVDRMSVLETVGHAGRYTDLTVLLRGLVPDLETAARALPETQRAEVYELMAATYQACSAALAKLGEPEAAYSHLDRAAEAAG
jgi:transcriptional regulator with XRE-family HTH domain